MRNWIAERIPGNRGRILDFGCDPKAPLGIRLVEIGFKVTSIDILPCTIENLPANFHYIQADITDFKFKRQYFDYIVSCSTLEHAGITGRYDSKDEPDQDIRIMKLFRRLLKKDGLQLMAIPVGVEAVIKPYHRAYGRKRLSQILEGWEVVEKEFWNFDIQDQRCFWYRRTEEEAFKQIPRTQEPLLTARGLYVLKLKNDKDKKGGAEIEENWILANIENYQGKTVLDFGSGPSANLGRKLARMGFEITCLDLKPSKSLTFPPNLKYIQKDILDINLLPASFSVIISNSTIEHAGLGRYGDKEELDQDLRIMKLFRKLLKPSGIMLLTIPVGIDTVMKPYHRIYGSERLPLLLKGWKILKEQFWIKNGNNIYFQTSREKALKDKPTGPEKPRYYAEGLFLLEIPK